MRGWPTTSQILKSFFYLLYYNVITLKCLKIILHSVYYLAFAQQNTLERNNERNAWAANNLARLDMPFLSIIA